MLVLVFELSTRLKKKNKKKTTQRGGGRDTVEETNRLRTQKINS